MRRGVLLINDSVFESLVMKDIVGKLGYEVEIADEFNVMKKLNSFQPDIVIANYVMYETTGDQIIHHIKREKPSIKCLLSSNNFLKMNDFKEKMVDEVIHTPVSGKDLEKIFNKLQNNDHDFSYCPFCSHELNRVLNKNIRYCPYCGKDLTII